MSGRRLPRELIDRIVDMACTKRSNHKKSKHVVMVISTDKRASVCEHDVTQWVLSRLDIIRPPDQDSHKNHFRIVVGIKDENYEDEEVQVLNTLVYAIYVRCGDNWDVNDDNLITYEEHGEEGEAIAADDILRHLHEEPDCVKRVGVSAICEEHFVDIWDEIISSVSSSFDVDGEGYMVHPMWQHFGQDIGWQTIGENSFNFGWDRRWNRPWGKLES